MSTVWSLVTMVGCGRREEKRRKVGSKVIIISKVDILLDEATTRR